MVASCPERKRVVSEDPRYDVVPVDESYLEEGDLLPKLVEVSSTNDLLTEQEFAMCDGEGGSAPPKGTKCA